MAKKYFSLLIIFSALLLLISPVNGEIQTLQSDPKLQKARENLKEIRTEKKEGIYTIRLNTKEKIASQKAELRSKIIQNKETIASQRAELRTKIINQIKETREEAKEKIASQRAEFKMKIEQLKDERKAIAVTKIDDKLVSMNKKQTEHFKTVLEKLANVLDNLAEKIDKAKANGQNTSEVEAAMTKAQSILLSAQNAVADQVAKEYIIKINKEDNIKADVGSVVRQLEADLQATRKTILNAKDTVHSVVKLWERLNSINVKSSPSTTVQ